MTTWLLAGGGTAGHVNPLLAVADTLRRRDPETTVLVLGTREGLESRLVPDRGYELLTVPKLPFPRRLNPAALRFGPDFRRAVARVAGLLAERSVDAVVGFGGYAAAPAYLAARRTAIPLALHEANARPGIANRLGARLTDAVGVAFPGTPLPHATVVGMPLRREIELLDRAARRTEALAAFSLDPDRPVLLVTGGSLGARRINGTMRTAADSVIAAGYQILHLTGANAPDTDPGLLHYRRLEYTDRMDLALAACDFAISRAGAATVSELTALGIPAVYVPYPVGNGEQRFNARGVVAERGGLLVEDSAFLPSWVENQLIPVLRDPQRRARMAEAAVRCGRRDGSDRMVDLVLAKLDRALPRRLEQ